MGDQDLLAGRKEIMQFLRLADWSAIMSRVDNGMPAVKVCGRWEMSISDYRKWREALSIKGTMMIPADGKNQKNGRQHDNSQEEKVCEKDKTSKKKRGEKIQ